MPRQSKRKRKGTDEEAAPAEVAEVLSSNSKRLREDSGEWCRQHLTQSLPWWNIWHLTSDSLSRKRAFYALLWAPCVAVDTVCFSTPSRILTLS